MTKKVFFPNLDGLRFFAFLFIFFCHSFYTESASVKESGIFQTIKHVTLNGNVGVNFFFVLSGFLITYLLLEERFTTGRIHIGAFYVRRILRIWPLYYAVVIFGYFFIPYFMHLLGEPYVEHSRLIDYFLFINNLVSQQSSSAVLGILWSIAVEEQFYLFWPLIIAFVPAKKYPYVFIFLISLSVVLRGFQFVNYQHTLNCISDLVLGSWVAVLAFNRSVIIEKISSVSKRTNVLIYLTGFILILFKEEWDLWYTHAYSRLLLGLFFCYILIDQNYGKNSFFKMVNNRFSTIWGKYTYGLYLLHFIAIYPVSRYVRTYLGDNLFNTAFTTTVLSFLLALPMAWLSFHLYEKHFLKLKNKFSYFNSSRLN